MKHQDFDQTLFEHLAAIAAQQTLKWFRQPIDVENKLDIGFDPVTIADQSAEQAIRNVLQHRFPEHGIWGEEYGRTEGDGQHMWIIDPIDGTRAFISGVPVWGTLVGLTIDGKAQVGMLSQPYTGELFWSCQSQSWHKDANGKQPLKTRNCTELDQAVLMTTSPKIFPPDLVTAYESVEAQVKLTRYGLDCYAYGLVAAGHADLVIEAGLNAYDIAALIPIIENAGGIVTTWRGDSPENGGDIIAAATHELHGQAIRILQSQS